MKDEQAKWKEERLIKGNQDEGLQVTLLSVADFKALCKTNIATATELRHNTG